MQTTNRSRNIGRAVQVILPFAAIVSGNFAGIEWLSWVGAIALGWVVASALLREPVSEAAHPPLRKLWFALAAPIVTGTVLIPLLLLEPPSYLLLPALAIGIVLIYLALGYLMWWLIRLNNA